MGGPERPGPGITSWATLGGTTAATSTAEKPHLTVGLAVIKLNARPGWPYRPPVARVAPARRILDVSDGSSLRVAQFPRERQ
jgi:hypothetical protein